MWTLLFRVSPDLQNFGTYPVKYSTSAEGNCCHNQRGEQRYFSGIDCFLIHCVAMATEQILGEEGLGLSISLLQGLTALSYSTSAFKYLLMDYLSVQLNTEVSPEGKVCILEPFKMLFKVSLFCKNKIKKRRRVTNLCCDECCRFDI